MHFHTVDSLCMAMCSPTGKVFSDEDLAFIARLCVKYNTYAVCDEARAPVLFGLLFLCAEMLTSQIRYMCNIMKLFFWRAAHAFIAARLIGTSD